MEENNINEVTLINNIHFIQYVSNLWIAHNFFSVLIVVNELCILKVLLYKA